MALDLETNRNIIDSESPNGVEMEEIEIVPNWKKSILLEGMINPTGKGARLGVFKVTDAITGKSMGRLQARRKDSVSFFTILV